MWNAQIFGHFLEDLTEGVTVFREGVGKPVPLLATEIDIDIVAGLAVVVTTRKFTNKEDMPIEAILTMPVGFNAIVTGLSATLDGREMRAVAQPKDMARDTFEDAIDQGKMAVLHEEALRGIHILSIGQLAPGTDVSVQLRMVVPLAASAKGPFLRLPMTAGHLYGSTPLQPADDLITDASIHHEARLRIRNEEGQANLAGVGPIESGGFTDIALDRAVEIVVEGGGFGALKGVSASGQEVNIELSSQNIGAQDLELAILVDRSGSTGSATGDGSRSVLSAMRDGLSDALSTLKDKDKIALWQFDDMCQCLGTGHGMGILPNLKLLEGPGGGTAIARAIRTVAARGIKDILILTDGQTWDALQPLAADLNIRISAVLVGSASLDANIGHLCAMTGGDLFYAPDGDVAGCVRLALESKRSSQVLRRITMAGDRPREVQHALGGVLITATWSDAKTDAPGTDIGRFAAGLCLGSMDERTAKELAVAEGLCSPFSSLILVDDVAEVSQGISETRKIPLMAHRLDAILTPDSLHCLSRRSISAGTRTRQPNAEPFLALVSTPSPLLYMQEPDPQKPDLPKALRRNAFDILDNNPSIIAWQAKTQSEIKQSLEDIAEGIDWNTQINRFLTHDFDGLTPQEAAILDTLCMEKVIIRFSWKRTTEPMLVALGWFAHRFAPDSKAAQRFARKVLGLISGSKTHDGSGSQDFLKT